MVPEAFAPWLELEDTCYRKKDRCWGEVALPRLGDVAPSRRKGGEARDSNFRRLMQSSIKQQEAFAKLIGNIYMLQLIPALAHVTTIRQNMQLFE